MRTTVDFPDALFRQLKAQAALQGVPMKDLVLAFVERGLRAPGGLVNAVSPVPRGLPTLQGRPTIPRQAFTNAGLFDLLDAGGDSEPGRDA